MKWICLLLVCSLISVGSYAQKKVVPLTPKNDQIINDPNSIEVNPSFPGGQKAFYKFLSKNLKWPSDNMDDTFGRVIISFMVEKDGSLSDFKVERSVGKKFDAEALRVLKKSPKWIPGKQNGKFVRVRYTVPINFSIND